MIGFGKWLQDSAYQLKEVRDLRAVAAAIGNRWPLNSSEQADYEGRIKEVLPLAEQTEAINTLHTIWPVYESESGLSTQDVGIIPLLAGADTSKWLFYTLIASGLFILYMFFQALSGINLTELA